nr:hypothetical protein BgiMline_024669 [Biomphalaria glabrata]
MARTEGSSASGSGGGGDKRLSSRDLKALNIKVKKKEQQLVCLLAYVIVIIHCALVVSLTTITRLSLWILEVHAENTRRTEGRTEDGHIRLSSDQEDPEAIIVSEEERNSDNQMVVSEMGVMSPETSDSTPLVETARPNNGPIEDTDTSSVEMSAKDLCLGAIVHPERVPIEDTDTSSNEMSSTAEDLCLGATVQPKRVPIEHTDTPSNEMSSTAEDLCLGATVQPERVPIEDTETTSDKMECKAKHLCMGVLVNPDNVPVEDTDTSSNEMPCTAKDISLGATIHPYKIPIKDTETTSTEMGAIAKPINVPVEDTETSSNDMACTKAKALTEGKRSSNAPWSGKMIGSATPLRKRPPDKVKEECSPSPTFTYGLNKGQELRSYCGLKEGTTHERTHIQAQARGEHERIAPGIGTAVNCTTEETDDSKEKEVTSEQTNNNPNRTSNAEMTTSDQKQESASSQDVDLKNITKRAANNEKREG